MDSAIYLTQWAMLITVFSLAVLSPGPDFVLAVRNSILHSRRIGVLTALGFGLGVLIHATYTVLGIAAVIAQSVLIFNTIKYLGAAYLVYIGIQALRSRGASAVMLEQSNLPQETSQSPMSGFAALRQGFLTNLLNPKATLFFLAIFSQIIRPDTPKAWLAIYGLTCAIMVTVWFSAVAFVLTHAPIRNRFLKAAKVIDRVCGSLMIALGIKVALSSR